MTTNKKEFAELLKGCVPLKDKNGDIIVQTILNMQIVALTTEPQYSFDNRFANPMKALVASNHSYGHINFQNIENKETIVPTQLAILTKQHAQNHAMTKAGYVAANDNVEFTDAGCIQGSDGGHFHNTQEYRFVPLAIREMFFDAVTEGNSYNRTYPAVRKLGNMTNSNTSEYLDRYFTKYDKKLEEFIAHFERPDHLIGMIVLINGEVVAVDKFPSYSYAEQVWEAMIRDSYGSMAIISELKESKPKKLFTEEYKHLIKHNHAESIVEMIEKALNNTKEKINKAVYEKLEEVLPIEFDTELDTNGHSPNLNVKSFLLKHEGYVGQVIEEEGLNHLVSVVKRESFDPKSIREITELRRKARNQDRFSL